MEIIHWNFKLQDIDIYPNEIYDHTNSVLANSVVASNYELKGKITSDQNILEVGCGTNSWLKDNLNLDKCKWKGIDIKKFDNGKLGIATEIGSVHDMPYSDSSFDFILANQSIEHWSEYGISIDDGLREIGRCLKQNGEIHINFPLFLHGEPIFVKGDIETIIKIIEKHLSIEEIKAYYSKKHENYQGWKLCGFPDWLIQNTKTSFVVNVILKKKLNFDYSKKINKINLKKRNIYALHLRYGFHYFIWKVYNFFKRLLKKICK